MTTHTPRAFHASLAAALIVIVGGLNAIEAQRGSPQQGQPPQPFKGLTATGTIEPGLFPIKATGVSTRPVREAAQNFLQSLTAEQRAKTAYGGR
jgi:hypothetical protein